MTAKGKGFGALSKLREVEQKSASARAGENRAAEVADPWVPLGTEVHDSTKRRLKVFASQSGQTMKELTDQAINAHLDGLEK